MNEDAVNGLENTQKLVSNYGTNGYSVSIFFNVFDNFQIKKLGLQYNKKK
jgi:hypothetical protein